MNYFNLSGLKCNYKYSPKLKAPKCYDNFLHKHISHSPSIYTFTLIFYIISKEEVYLEEASASKKKKNKQLPKQISLPPSHFIYSA